MFAYNQIAQSRKILLELIGSSRMFHTRIRGRGGLRSAAASGLKPCDTQALDDTQDPLVNAIEREPPRERSGCRVVSFEDSLFEQLCHLFGYLGRNGRITI